MRQIPTVSVVITCYNYGDYVDQAIKSVLAQTYKNLSLLIIDDGSTDNSLEVISGYEEDSRVQIVARKNKGIVYTRNEALKLAKGEYICFLDADDYFDHDYIENMVDVAQKHNADVVYPNWHIFGDHKYNKEFPEFDIQKLIRQEIHCTSESLIRKAAVDGHVFESEEVAEDWDFFLGLALDGRKFQLAKDCYINYRVRKGTRGTVRSYWDDMYHFYNILQKWAKLYPRIVNPVDLLIYAGRLRDDHISSQSKIIQEKETAYQNALVELRKQTEVLKKLQHELTDVRQSYAYRVGRAILLPLRLTKSLLKR